MKSLLRFAIALVAVLCFIALSSVKETAAVAAPVFVAIKVEIDCPGHVSKGTVASITLTAKKGRSCPDACFKGSGGTATFDGNGHASATIDPACTATDLGNCEVAATWQDTNGNAIKRQATIDRRTTPLKAVIKC
ncbi:MAG: hypothetical protein AB1631_01675 [Acidobacteriota bacterium]